MRMAGRGWLWFFFCQILLKILNDLKDAKKINNLTSQFSMRNFW